MEPICSGSMTDLIISRHAESRLTARHVVNGDPDVSDQLTPDGKRQARLLGRLLAGTKIDLCVTSRFPRTRETASVALRGRPVPRLVDSDLDDMPFGDLEGQMLDVYRDWYRKHGPSEPIPGSGESRRTTVARFVSAFRRIAHRPEAAVLVIAHGLAVAYLVRAVAGTDLDAAIRPAPHALPYTFSSRELRAGLAVLEAWVEVEVRK